MQLRDLLELSDHRIRVLYGDEHHLDREITSPYTTDLLDSSRYLTPGQLVMTGLMWRRTPEDSDTFVSVLAAGGINALVAGDALYGMVPDDVVEACRKYGMPLLGVPADVSFAEITDRMAMEAANDRVKRLTARMVRQRQLLTEVTEGKALDELVMQVSRETGLPAWVITTTGRHVVTGSGELSTDDVDLIIQTVLGATRLPASAGRPAVGTAVASPAFSVHAIGSTSEPRATAWFLVVGGDMTLWSSPVQEAVSELTAIAGLERARQESGLRAWQEITDRAVSNVENHSERPESAVMLSQVGVDTDGPLVVVVADFVGRPDLNGVARWLLTDAVSQFGIPVVGAGDDGSPVALISIPAAPPGNGRMTDLRVERSENPVAAALRRSFTRITPALLGAQFAVGVSRPTPLASAGGALRSARYSRLLGEKSDQAAHIGSSEEVVTAVQLLTAIPDHLRQTFAEHVLGAVVEYDRRNNADLMPTLRAFLVCAGSWSKTAALLHLHLNTVRYRVARVEELTGRDLGRVADRTDIYLACNCSEFGPGVQPGVSARWFNPVVHSGAQLGDSSVAVPCRKSATDASTDPPEYQPAGLSGVAQPACRSALGLRRHHCRRSLTTVDDESPGDQSPECQSSSEGHTATLCDRTVGLGPASREFRAHPWRRRTAPSPGR